MNHLISLSYRDDISWVGPWNLLS